MSISRRPWTNDELSLLIQIRTQNPDAGLDGVIEMFNRMNSRKRSIPAIKQKWRDVRTLKERQCLSVVQSLLQEIPEELNGVFTKQGRSVISSKQQEITIKDHQPIRETIQAFSHGMLSQLQISVPVQPLLRDARSYVENPRPVVKDKILPLEWPSALFQGDVSHLNCSEGDKMALKLYFEYLQKCQQAQQDLLR